MYNIVIFSVHLGFAMIPLFQHGETMTMVIRRMRGDYVYLDLRQAGRTAAGLCTE